MIDDIENQEAATPINQRFLIGRKVTFYRQQHSGQSLGILRYRLVFLGVEIGDPEEVGQRHTPLKYICIVFEAFECLFWLIVFIVDVADNFLEHVLESDNSLGSAEFVDHDRHVYLELSEVFQKIVDHS